MEINMFLLKKFLGDKYDRVNQIIDSYNNIVKTDASVWVR